MTAEAKPQLFVTTAYSKHKSLTGELKPSFVNGLSVMVATLKEEGFIVISSLMDNDFTLEDDPKKAFESDLSNIRQADATLAILDVAGSKGLDKQIGMAIGESKPLLLGHTTDLILAEQDVYAKGIVDAGKAHEVIMPITDFAQLHRLVKG